MTADPAGPAATVCFACGEPVGATDSFCESCGAVVTTREHLEWIAERLGPQRFANPNLMIVAEEKLGLSKPQLAHLHGGPIQRADMVRILCNQCRRAVLTREVYGQ